MHTSAEQQAFFKGLINFMPIHLKQESFWEPMGKATKELTRTFAEAMMAAHGVPCAHHRISLSPASDLITLLRPEINDTQYDRELRVHARQIFNLDDEGVYAMGHLHPVAWGELGIVSQPQRILGPQELRNYRYFRFDNAGIPAPSLLVEIEDKDYGWRGHGEWDLFVMATPADVLMYHERANALFAKLYQDTEDAMGGKDKVQAGLDKIRKERRGY